MCSWNTHLINVKPHTDNKSEKNTRKLAAINTILFLEKYEMFYIDFMRLLLYNEMYNQK